MRGVQPNLEASGFQSPLPASTMVEVTKMTSPEYLIEMSAIAVIPD
jgi:2-iminobutanoate/2-iminopropanoate deaminase